MLAIFLEVINIIMFHQELVHVFLSPKMPLSVNIGQSSFLILVGNGRNFQQNWSESGAKLGRIGREIGRKQSEMVEIWRKPPLGGGGL